MMPLSGFSTPLAASNFLLHKVINKIGSEYKQTKKIIMEDFHSMMNLSFIIIFGQDEKAFIYFLLHKDTDYVHFFLFLNHFKNRYKPLF